jgi:dihydroflavonol-4-reductase
MEKLYVVTGANGHLGSNIVRNLIQRGEKVIPMILPGDTSPALKDLPVKLVQANVLSPEELNAAFSDICKGVNPSSVRVIHTAGIVFISSAHQEIVEKVNVSGTQNIVDVCRKFGIERLVYISTVHAIPEKEKGKVITEISHFDSELVEGLYAKTKAKATQIVLDAAKQGMNGVVVHPSGIIGPGDYNRGHQTQLFIDYLKGRLTACVRGGYDFVDVRDVAEGTIAACEKGRKGESYILSNRYIEVMELMDILHHVSGCKRIKTVLPMALAKFTAPLSEIYYKILRQKPLYTRYSLYALESNSLFSHEKATNELGYQPRPIEDTVYDTYKWLKEVQFV